MCVCWCVSVYAWLNNNLWELFLPFYHVGSWNSQVFGLGRRYLHPWAISPSYTACVSHVRSGIELLTLWLAIDYGSHWVTDTDNCSVFSCLTVASLWRYFYHTTLSWSWEKKNGISHEKSFVRRNRGDGKHFPRFWILALDRAGVDTNSAIHCRVLF